MYSAEVRDLLLALVLHVPNAASVRGLRRVDRHDLDHRLPALAIMNGSPFAAASISLER